MHRANAILRALAANHPAAAQSLASESTRRMTSSAAPATSKALVFSKPGQPDKVLSVRHIPLPPLGPTSVLVKILAAPVNPADVNVIQGTYPVQPVMNGDYGAVGGNEGVCEVLAKGHQVSGLQPGDWVIPLTRNVGTWQTHAVADSSDFLKLANVSGISPILAATISVNPPTAYRMLKDFVSLKQGDVVIQNLSNSAVGQSVIQLSRAWGIKTVNIIRDRPGIDTTIDYLKKIGADLVITEEQVRLPETAKQIALLGRPPKLALNGVGGKSATNMARLLGEHGHMVTYGGMSKEPVTLPTSLFIFKDIKCSGFWMNKWYLTHTLADREAIYAELFDLARAGQLLEPLHEKFSLLDKADSELIPILKKKLQAYVGFHNLPQQYHRKALKKGFQFTLMVVGESGLGKSTLINTLFNTGMYPPKEEKEPTHETPKTVEIKAISAELEENGVKLQLTCIDTPGFGDFVNNEDSWRPILENIESRFDAYLEQENRVNRKKIVDTRVHACLYFIAPTGHSLKPLDIEFMKRLCGRVNLIPVIAKSDTLTEEEIVAFKSRILEDVAANNITIYQPPTYENDDPETAQENQLIISKIPFAVVGSDKEVEVNGKKVRGRRYPWGVIEIENESHCDFVKLRQMLIRTHMEELKEYTNEVLYETYRMHKLAEIGNVDNIEAHISPMSKFEQERQAHEQKMAKMEAEMKAVFQQKVAEKEAKLKQSEDELYARHREMKEQLERQRLELDDRKKRLEAARTGGADKAKKSKGLFK